MDTQPTILVVDDNAISRKFTGRALTELYIVKSAENATDGLRQAKQFLPDAIPMDVEMSGLNGYRACEILKITPTTQHIPIIFLSSLSSTTSHMHGYEAGGDDISSSLLKKRSYSPSFKY